MNGLWFTEAKGQRGIGAEGKKAKGQKDQRTGITMDREAKGPRG